MSPKIAFFNIFGSKNGKKKVEIEGVGPIWRDPRRNSVQKAVPGVPYGGMATHLVTKRCDFGSLGFRAWPAHPGQGQNRPWVPHAGEQDDGSLHKLLQKIDENLMGKSYFGRAAFS